MKKNIFFIIILIPILHFGQCNVKTLSKNGTNFESMTEMFWDSTKTRAYSEGVDGYYFSTNNLGSEFEIVITHLLMNYDDSNIPNKLLIIFPSGKKIEKTATNFSHNTFNFVSKAPANTRSIECNFLFSKEEINLILSESTFEKILIGNYKNNTTMQVINSSDIYSGQLTEMLNCIKE